MSNSTYPWDTKAWFSDPYVRELSMAQRGLYREMLDLSWEIGPLPDPEHKESQARLANMVGIRPLEFRKLWKGSLPKCWVSNDDGGVVNPHMERIRAAHQRRKTAGRRGADGRWQHPNLDAVLEEPDENRIETASDPHHESHPFAIATASEPHNPGDSKELAETPDRNALTNRSKDPNQSSNKTKEQKKERPWIPAPREEGDHVWFLDDGSLSWRVDIERFLVKLFPALSRTFGRRGQTWNSELMALSVWHMTCPRSKKKQLNAQRWLLGRLFPRQEKHAGHAEKHKPNQGKAEPKAYGGLRAYYGTGGVSGD